MKETIDDILEKYGPFQYGSQHNDGQTVITVYENEKCKITYFEYLFGDCWTIEEK